VKGPFKGLRPFTRGNLYRLISNPIYLGKLEHGDAIYDGQHAAIIDQDLWNQVQARLRDKTVARRSPTNTADIHLLTGLVFDETGDRLSPTHAQNHGRRYRYYISNRLMQAHRKDKDGWRLRADRLEHEVIAELTRFLSNTKQVIDLTQITLTTAEDIEDLREKIEDLKKTVREGTPAAQRETLGRFVSRVLLDNERLQISLDISKLRTSGLGVCKLWKEAPMRTHRPSTSFARPSA
jgi:site-specific DNA recombinase